jgi:DNA-binding NarL/FixJ family response regulator
LEHLLAGESESEIAAQLFRSSATVHEHILAVYRHFCVSTRAQLMSYIFSRRPLLRPVTSYREE